ncbi:GPI ethanolamine phosphate transferase 3-like [Mytilus californianus]|uniref:GPI ethanolamine phosphate transferase 3-like n=1 Tax=Mytilus californianus TaxID=6549 RepID=UPI0022466391|nr:GPI ethanolamine phosphate transferase 3-like [Mytilus californianus]
MGQNFKCFFLLCFLILLYVCGLLIFAKGFLLKRVVVERNSSCKVDFAMQSDMHGEKGCWMHVRYKKAIIIVIDALRYDFASFDSTANDSIPYKNRLNFIKNSLMKPNNAKLYKFIADPPTTTLQRLKGLTTGSLPTFVDAGSNFASSEITEDNFIDQLIRHNKRIKFLGDDTWIGLFPNRFYKQIPFPSFNVKDLHTVDDGVLKHLYKEQNKNDWEVLVAHFLGVDHCGHRYGPNHSAMRDKLSQMNDMIRNVTRLMKDDTILFVMGDHGMTKTGDHGGDSKDELEAALFVYSPAQITSQHNLWKERDTISQIDFVPTISLLLGIPIPFSNLGQVIEELFTHCPWWQTTSDIKKVYHSTKALRLNAKQISYYLTSYYEYSSDFPIQTYYELQNLLDHAEKDLQALVTAMVKDGATRDITEDLKILRGHYIEYISEVGKICKGIWAKFDMMSISIGILTLILAISTNIYYIRISDSSEVPNTVVILILYCVVYLTYAVFQTFFVGETLSAFMVYILAVVGIIMIWILTYNFSAPEAVPETCLSLNINNIFSWMIMLLYFVLFFSNSFVVHEDSVTLFYTQTLSWIFCFKSIQSFLVKYDTSQLDQKAKRHKTQHKTYDIMRTLTQPSILAIFVTLLLNVLVRFSSNFRACREEQWTCSLSLFLYPLASLPDELTSYRNVRYFFSVGCVIFFLLAIRKYVKHSGNFQGNSAGIICIKYIYPVCGVAIALHWALQGLPQPILDALPVWQQIFLPRLVYILLFISFIATTIKPLTIHLLPKQEKFSVQADGTVIPQVYNKIKQNFKDEKEAEHPPIVFGLGTTYSSALINFVVIFYLLLVLLLGDGTSPSLLFAFLSVWLFLEVYTASVTFTKMVFSGDESSGFGLTKACKVNNIWPPVVFMSTLFSSYFYL